LRLEDDKRRIQTMVQDLLTNLTTTLSRQNSISGGRITAGPAQYWNENPEIQQVKRVLSDKIEEQSDTIEGQKHLIRRLSNPRWILAEQDYPVASTPWNCFPSRSTTVLVYDMSTRNLGVEEQNELRDRNAIVARLPSKRPTAVHVYQESQAWRDQTSSYRVRLTTKYQDIEGLMFDRTIYLNHLSIKSKASIITGVIKWLFILRTSNDDSSCEKASISSGW